MLIALAFILGCWISYRLGREAGIDFYCDHDWIEGRNGIGYYCPKCHRTRIHI